MGEQTLSETNVGRWYNLHPRFSVLSLAIQSADVDSSGNVWAGSGAVVKKSTDGGATWADIFTCPGTPNHLRRVFVDSRDYIFISPYSGTEYGLWRSTDGSTFTKVHNLDTDCSIWGIDEDASGDLYIGEYSLNGAGQTQIWKSTDDGATWVQKFTQNESAIVNEHIHDIRVDPATGWIYATAGDISPDPLLRSKDGGETWTEIASLTERMAAISFLGGYVYLGSDIASGNKITRFQDGGGAAVTLEDAYTLPNGYDAYIFAATETSSQMFFGSADGGPGAFGVYASTDGTTWTRIAELPATTEGFHWISRKALNGAYFTGGSTAAAVYGRRIYAAALM